MADVSISGSFIGIQLVFIGSKWNWCIKYYELCLYLE